MVQSPFEDVTTVRSSDVLVEVLAAPLPACVCELMPPADVELETPPGAELTVVSEPSGIRSPGLRCTVRQRSSFIAGDDDAALLPLDEALLLAALLDCAWALEANARHSPATRATFRMM